MAYKIDAEKCVGCKICLDTCPVGCISFDEDTNKCVIDADSCASCGACAGECPEGAIEEE